MDNERAITLLCQMYLPHFNDEEKEALSMGIEALEKQTWISVDDRLPERRQLVLIQKKYRINNIYYALGWYQDNDWYINFEKIEDNEVLAWIPLPEPYKEGGKDE